MMCVMVGSGLDAYICAFETCQMQQVAWSVGRLVHAGPDLAAGRALFSPEWCMYQDITGSVGACE